MGVIKVKNKDKLILGLVVVILLLVVGVGYLMSGFQNQDMGNFDLLDPNTWTSQESSRTPGTSDNTPAQPETCTVCHGTGTVTSSGTYTCPDCRGTGLITVVDPGGQEAQGYTCDRCHGTGELGAWEEAGSCDNCGGDGIINN